MKLAPRSQNEELKKKIIFQGVFLIFLFFWVSASSVEAKKASLTGIRVTNTWDYCLLDFQVTDCFTEEMRKAIDNGIPTTFIFYIKLQEIRGFWWNKKVADLKVSHDIQYDNLKKVYRVRLSEKNNRVFVVQDFQQAKKLMSEIKGFGVTELSNLQMGNRYQILMMAELDKIRLPFYLHYILFFLSLWDFDTDWYTVKFQY